MPPQLLDAVLYLLDPTCMPSVDPPSSRPNFFPSKRSPVREEVPLSFFTMTMASLDAGAASST